MSTAQAAFALDGSRKLFASLVALAASESGNQVWIHCASVGEWSGHPAGAFKFTREVFDRIIANAADRSTAINCDYEHQTFRKGQSGAVPSSGRIIKLERRGDELWALAELTPRAVQLVRDGEYRSCSPVIEFESKDRRSGKDIGPEMLSLALTNDPFQDGLQPIRLTRSADMADEEKKPEDEKKEDEPTKLADPAVDEAAEAVDANSVFDALAEAAGADKASVLAFIADNVDKLASMIQDGLAKGDGNPSEGKAMSKLLAVTGDIRTLRTELRVKDKTVVQLTERIEKLEAQAKADNDAHAAKEAERVKAHVLSLQKSGHVGPDAQDIDDAVALFSANWDRAARTYSRQVVPVGAPDTEDESNPDAPTGPVTLSNLDDKTKARVEFMMRAGVAQDDALKAATAQAAGKGN